MFYKSRSNAMKRSCTLIVMSLVLLLGLWGYSMSMESPYPRDPLSGYVAGGPSEGDHPWGGDEGHGGNTPSSIGPNKPIISTGNVVLDVVVNQVLFRTRFFNLFYSTKTQTTNTGSTVKPNPTVNGTSNSVN
jgi:hypothetical protein